MKHTLLLALLFFYTLTTRSQDNPAPGKDYRNFPLIVTLQFQNLAFPFHDLKGNFSNVGLLVGTEVSLNGKQNWAQQVQAGFYINKNAGNGFTAFTQTVYRPTVFKNFYPEVKAGVGWLRVFHPVEAYEFDGSNYVPLPGGKSQLIVPLGVSVGYNRYSENTYFSPFVSYQVIPALFYNDGVPLNFYSMFQVGTRVHFK